MRYLNLGCGHRYCPSKEWTNVDFVSTGESIQAHNLLSGIPYESNSFDLVYHSHVLEHFSEKDGVSFIAECFRVLKPGGVIRVVVPNLEQIAREYLRTLELASTGEDSAKHDYKWIKLELFDQMVRNNSGGEMAGYLSQNEIPNEEFVTSRIGQESARIKSAFKENSTSEKNSKRLHIREESVTRKSTFQRARDWLLNKLFGKELWRIENQKELIEIGRFRKSGEIHLSMYDRFSLSEILQEAGFQNFEIKDAFTSRISNWDTFHLETDNGKVMKPDSIFVEALKPPGRK